MFLIRTHGDLAIGGVVIPQKARGVTRKVDGKQVPIVKMKMPNFLKIHDFGPLGSLSG